MLKAKAKYNFRG